MQYGSLKPDIYRSRVTDAVLVRLLETVGAVEVAGTMWCGKTWTSMAFGNSITRVGSAAVRSAVESDPSIALIGPAPHVIDEWQDVPPIWDEVRAAVDDAAGMPGQFILTGSSEPNKDRTRHSGAGRIAKLRMRTMSLYETGESTGAVSLSGLFHGKFQPQLVQQKLAPLAEIICRGGWPQLIGRSRGTTAAYLNGYWDALFDINIPRRGVDKAESRRVARSLARNIGGAATLSTIAADAGLDQPDGKAAHARARQHILTLSDLYVLESVTGWDAPVRSKSRVRTKPKYYFADPSLAAALLGVSPDRLIVDGQLFGLLFESLCIHDLLVYVSAMPEAAPDALVYYRDSDGLEADAVIELRDGRWGALEIKLGENKAGDGIRSLVRLRNKVASNPAARNPEPSFLAVLVGSGEVARQDKETGVYIIPITVLGP